MHFDLSSRSAAAQCGLAAQRPICAIPRLPFESRQNRPEHFLHIFYRKLHIFLILLASQLCISVHKFTLMSSRDASSVFRDAPEVMLVTYCTDLSDVTLVSNDTDDYDDHGDYNDLVDHETEQTLMKMDENG